MMVDGLTRSLTVSRVISFIGCRCSKREDADAKAVGRGAGNDRSVEIIRLRRMAR